LLSSVRKELNVGWVTHGEAPRISVRLRCGLTQPTGAAFL
jgi:hypothetical protein